MQHRRKYGKFAKKTATRPALVGENLKVGVVEAVSFGGRGVLRHEGKVYFIEGALPGDHIKARITREKKSFGEGYVASYLESAPLRKPSPCPSSRDCGGCQWLEVDSSQQETWKANFIQDALSRIASSSRPIDRFVSSPQALHYRNRVSLKGEIRRGKILLGYYAPRSHKLVAIDACSIAHKTINDFIKSMQDSSFNKSSTLSFDLSLQVILGEQLLVELQPKGDAAPTLLQQLKDVLSSQPMVKSLTSHQQTAPDMFIYDRQYQLEYWTYQGQFQQVNSEANHILRETVKQIVNHIKPNFILDLYCGSGNLSLHLASPQRRVLGIESNPHSIKTALQNLRHNQVENTEYLNLTSESFLSSLRHEPQSPDLVIIDPPRRGLETAISDLINLAPQHIIYVSCDPNTLARDLKRLQESSYRMTQVIGMDFFPGTYHVESLVVLNRNP